MPDANWYATAQRKALIDNHLDGWLPGYDKYDSQRIAATMINSDFECGMIYARCHMGSCYWNASQGPKHAGLGEHDQIGELGELLPASGLHFIAAYREAGLAGQTGLQQKRLSKFGGDYYASFVRALPRSNLGRVDWQIHGRGGRRPF